MASEPESAGNHGLFGSAVDGRRRSVVFAIAMMTGFLGVVSTTSLVLAGEHVPLIVLLALCSGLAFAFGGFVFAGRFEELFADDQLFWQLTE